MPARALPLLLLALVAPTLAGCGSDCTTVHVGIGATCLPPVANANEVLFLHVREACGTNCAGAPSCSAVLLDGAVQLQLEEDQCTSFLVNCRAQPCQQRVVSCKVQALAAGDYPVVVPGSQSRVLRVRDSGGASSCSVPDTTAAGR